MTKKELYDKRKKMVGEPVSEEYACREINLPLLRCWFGDDISWFDAVGKLMDAYKENLESANRMKELEQRISYLECQNPFVGGCSDV